MHICVCMMCACVVCMYGVYMYVCVCERKYEMERKFGELRIEFEGLLSTYVPSNHTLCSIQACIYSSRNDGS